MATRPCNAWNTPVMIIMIAANMMNPTAQPLVCRPAREYASLLTADPSSARMTDRTMAPAEDADITPFGMNCAGGKPPLGGPGAVSVGSWHRAQSRSSPSAEEACRFRAVSMSAEVRNWAHAGTDDLPDRCPWSAGPTLLHGMA